MNFEKIIVQNPSDNYKVIAEVDSSTSQEIDQKVELAHRAYSQWSQKSVEERVYILQKLLDNFVIKKNDIAELIAIEVGMPISVCLKIDIEVGINYFKGYLDHAKSWLKPEIVFENHKELHTMFFEPLGVVGASIPWNYPFTNFIWAVIQNLVVGNTILIKHSENCTLTAKFLEKIVQASGLPEGICSFVYGKGHDVGNYLINSDIDMIWFVGSVATGHHIYQVAASKDIPVVLELGGSAPGIVFEDAYIDQAVESVYFYRFVNSGQSCDALKRLIVHESIFETFIQKLISLILKKNIGTPLNTKTDIGPLVTKKQLEMIQQQVADAVQKGGKIICGGKQPEGLQGGYYLPTIITGVKHDMRIWTEEVFGPVLPAVSFKTQEEAVDFANNTVFGLGSYVYSSDKNRAIEVAKKLKTGSVSINGTNYVIPQDPFGGYKKSGIGITHGRVGMQSLCKVKVIAQDI